MKVALFILLKILIMPILIIAALVLTVLTVKIFNINNSILVSAITFAWSIVMLFVGFIIDGLINKIV